MSSHSKLHFGVALTGISAPVLPALALCVFHSFDLVTPKSSFRIDSLIGLSLIETLRHS